MYSSFLATTTIVFLSVTTETHSNKLQVLGLWYFKQQGLVNYRVMTMSFDNDQYRTLFIEEAKEHIETITKSMLILEKEPENQEVVNMLFRSAHTLKGSSGMMGFRDFQELTHAMEDIFDDMRKGSKPSCNLISLLLECVDALTQRLENIQAKVEGEIDYEGYSAKLHSMKSELSRIEPNKELQETKTAEPTLETQQLNPQPNPNKTSHN